MFDFRKHFNFLLVEGRWTKLNQIPVCFEGRGNRPGQLMYTGTGVVLGALKLKWKSGTIRCVSDQAYNSRWGCHHYSSFTKYPFNVIVTDGKDKILFPLNQFIKHTSGLWWVDTDLMHLHMTSLQLNSENKTKLNFKLLRIVYILILIVKSVYRRKGAR